MVANKESISPLDGRYSAVAKPLADLFCETSLTLHRYRIEHAWLQTLARTPGINLRLSENETQALSRLAEPEPAQLVAEVSELERKTRHDVKALELCLAQRLFEAGLPNLVPWIHFGCTSWDINNLAYALMLRAAQHEVLIPALERLQDSLEKLAKANADLPMLARTHGQPASPTTLGKEFNVFANRLDRQLALLRNHIFDGKFNGAVGNYNAFMVALPNIDWPDLACDFVTGLGLNFAAVTTQIEPYDGMVEFFDVTARINRILLDLSQDLSLYTGMGYLQLAVVANEVGSSTMPHKVNPIAFENAEGNLALSNALLTSFGQQLQVSRLQRDLSDSTVLRNIGVALGHALVAWDALVNGLAGIEGNADNMATDLDRNWQVLSEAVQTILRSLGDAQAYDKLKEATRGHKHMDKGKYLALVNDLVPAGQEQDRLLRLTPSTYLGLAQKLSSCRFDETANPEKTR